MARPSDDDLPRAVEELATPLAAELGLELLAIEVKGQRGSRMIRLTVDAASLDPQVGVGVDDIALLSRRLEDSLDEHDPVPGAYTLEVTSPGADRPLTRPRDFARNRGRQVRVLLNDPEGAEMVGELTNATEATLTLATQDGDRELPYGAVLRGHVVLPW